METDPKTPRLDFPSAGRNAEPIVQVLRKELPPEARNVLEIASGSGQHAVHFSAALPKISWWPSDLDPAHINSIEAWRDGHGRIQNPVLLDVCAPNWHEGQAVWPPFFDALVNINMIHISPWEATQGLMYGAGRLLPPGGILFLYGPYKKDGKHTAPSNAEFDESLRGRNPLWGVRDLNDVTACANKNGLRLCKTIAMPANNLCVVFEKR